MSRITAAAAVLLSGHLFAQSAKPAFESASIKRRPPSPATSTVLRPAPPRVRGRTLEHVGTVREFILYAFDVKRWQITGGPAWVRIDQFEISARASRNAPESEMRLMMQSLLERRFGLVVHEVSYEVPLYALVLARPDGRLGRGLKPDERCTIKDQKLPGVPPTATRTSGCGPVSALVDAVSHQVDAPVIDRTGLGGVYHWTLYYNGPNMPSYRDALVEQLGLRLETTRAPLKGLMIDSVQRPSED